MPVDQNARSRRSDGAVKPLWVVGGLGVGVVEGSGAGSGVGAQGRPTDQVGRALDDAGEVCRRGHMQLERAVRDRRKSRQEDGCKRLPQVEPAPGDAFARQGRQRVSGAQDAVDDSACSSPWDTRPASTRRRRQHRAPRTRCRFPCNRRRYRCPWRRKWR